MIREDNKSNKDSTYEMTLARFVAKYKTGILQVILKHVIFNDTYKVGYNMGRKKVFLINWYCYSQVVVYILWDKKTNK